jgi:transposase-like protein
VRGLSVRDIEALAEVLGPEAALSKSTVIRICQHIRTEFEAWRTRDLSGVRLDYLFLDGSLFRTHPGRAGRARVGRRHASSTRRSPW